VKDGAGETVTLVRPEEELIGGPEVRFRLAAQTEDYGLAVRVADLLQRRHQRG
jgi:hypothetical protein